MCRLVKEIYTYLDGKEQLTSDEITDIMAKIEALDQEFREEATEGEHDGA
jgi:hypothetical protein